MTCSDNVTLTTASQQIAANGEPARIECSRGARAVSATRPRRCSATSPTRCALGSIPSGIVTYIIDRNVNYTNVCVARCNFCAFYRPVGLVGGLRPRASRRSSARSTRRSPLGGVQLLLQGGHNPDLPIEWYEDLFRAVKAAISRRSSCTRCRHPRSSTSRGSRRLPVPQVIDRLVAAGLDSIPGGGAEILVDRVRKLLNCYGKATADEWLDVMRHAHRAGLRTTATMMYGNRRDGRGAARAPVAAARRAGRDRRVHRVHHVELPARAHRAWRERGDRRRVPAHARASRVSCSTTSTTSRRRG